MKQGQSARLIAVFVMLLACGPVRAQQFVTFAISADGYRGDLNRLNRVNGFNAAVGYVRYIEEGVFLRIQAGSGSFSSEFELGNGTVYPDPVPPGFEPTLFFENRHQNADISLLLEVYTLGPVTLFGGLGAGVLQSKLFDGNGRRLEATAGSRVAGERVNGLAFTAPLSAGVLLFKDYRAQVSIERQWLLTNSDYLDNIGYAGTLGDDYLARTTLTVRIGL